MPTMFPSMASRPEDHNRRVTKWAPGDPTPPVVVVASVVLSVVGLLMLVSALFQLTAEWSRPPADPGEAERMEFVRRNVQYLGAVNLVGAPLILWLAQSLRQGYRGKRRWLLWISCLCIFFMLLGWVFGFTAIGQALMALGLAIGLLMAYRPAADPFFDAGHRLDAPVEGDGTLPGDQLRP